MIALIRIQIDDNHLTKQLNDLFDRLQDYDNKIMAMPEKLPPNELGNMSLYKSGWNDCIDYILGESNG